MQDAQDKEFEFDIDELSDDVLHKLEVFLREQSHRPENLGEKREVVHVEENITMMNIIEGNITEETTVKKNVAQENVAKEVVTKYSQAEKGLYDFYEDVLKKKSMAAKAFKAFPEEEERIRQADEKFKKAAEEAVDAEGELEAAQKKVVKTEAKFHLALCEQSDAGTALKNAKSEYAAKLKPTPEGFQAFKTSVMGLDVLGDA